MDYGDYLDSTSYLEDMTCNPDDTFQVLCQMQQMSHLDIFCSLCPHKRECQRKNLLEKDKNNVISWYVMRCKVAKLVRSTCIVSNKSNAASSRTCTNVVSHKFEQFMGCM